MRSNRRQFHITIMTTLLTTTNKRLERKKKLMFFLFLVAGEPGPGGTRGWGWGRGPKRFAAPPLPLLVLRRHVPPPKQVDAAHPVAQSGDAQVPRAAGHAAATRPRAWSQPTAGRAGASQPDREPPGERVALPRRPHHGAGRRRAQRGALQVLRQVLPRRGLPHRPPPRAHRRPAV